MIQKNEEYFNFLGIINYYNIIYYNILPIYIFDLLANKNKANFVKNLNK